MTKHRFAEIRSKTIAAWDRAGFPLMWKVDFNDGKESWSGDMYTEDLRIHEIEYQLQEEGANMELVQELTDLYYEMGKDVGEG